MGTIEQHRPFEGKHGGREETNEESGREEGGGQRRVSNQESGRPTQQHQQCHEGSHGTQTRQEERQVSDLTCLMFTNILFLYNNVSSLTPLTFTNKLEGSI